MAIEQEKFEQLIKEFTLDTDQLKTVADSFRKEMVSGLAREEGASMAMLNSYIGMPCRIPPELSLMFRHLLSLSQDYGNICTSYDIP